MEGTALKPWHQIVRLRDDLRSGELLMADFAADLYDVAIGNAKPLYQNPEEFFALTYPTYNLRELAKDVVLRLAGKNDKAIRQLELVYGGGKTHTLITLYHLTHDPANLPLALSSVDQFIRHIGQIPPQARIAVLAFDKLDVDKGMRVRSPEGEWRTLFYPWSVLAYQIAGDEGLQLLHAEAKAEERTSAPAEPVLIELLSLPIRKGLAPLILIDEVLMYVREQVGQYPNSRGSILNFFQALTQAVTKVNTCAMIVSLLATDPKKSDPLGKELINELSAVFRRELEQTVEPVVKEDVAEVLRRRFFTPESLKQADLFKRYAVTMVKNIAVLDEQAEKKRYEIETRFAASYPFHPDLTEILYAKWTQLKNFQRTRGMLRIFAFALRDAESWDRNPLISANIFLSKPGQTTLSDAAHELTNIAETEEYEGTQQQWTSILSGELEKAQAIQQEVSILRHREIEQAVFATFLHSQPIGRKATTHELLSLIGTAGPQKIDIEKALQRWMELSWFLDENAFQDPNTSQLIVRGLPGSWRLGSRPNLHQMHADASEHVSAEVIEARLTREIRECVGLTRGAAAAGARYHTLPQHPRDIEDDGEFHYVVLGPQAASRAGHPSKEAERYILEKTGPESPRVYNNSVIVATPSIDGLAALRTAIRKHQGWLEVRSQLKGQTVDDSRLQILEAEEKKEDRNVTLLVRQAYNIVVILSAKNTVISFQLAASDEPLFEAIKKDSRSRIQEEAVTAQALLPDGPYDLWREGDIEYRVNDLAKSFAQYARLPKMLNSKAIIQTLLDGCQQGLFVLRSDRRDESSRTYWFDNDIPSAAEARNYNLSVVLSSEAQLTTLPYYRLAPQRLETFPGLWQNDELPLRTLYQYFSGHAVSIGYAEEMTIPRASREVVAEAIHRAVEERLLWITNAAASFFGDQVPDDLLLDESILDDVILQGPPPIVHANELMSEDLKDMWKEEQTTAAAIQDALSIKYKKVLPWFTVRTAIDNALKMRIIERTHDSGPWPCTQERAFSVKLIPFKEKSTGTVSPLPGFDISSAHPIPGKKGIAETPDTLYAEAMLRGHEIQDLADQIAKLISLCADLGLPEPAFQVKLRFENTASLSRQQIETLAQNLYKIAPQLKLEQQV